MPTNHSLTTCVLFVQQLTNSNNMINYSTITTALVLFFLSFSASAQTYTTMTTGAWTNTTNVWSTNGGASPCGCTPGAAPGAITVNVAHPLTVTPNMSFIGTTMTVMATGSLTGAFDLSVFNGNLDI